MSKQPDLTIPESAPGYLDPIPGLLDAARAAQARVATLEEAYRSAEVAKMEADRSCKLAIRDGGDVEVSETYSAYIEAVKSKRDAWRDLDEGRLARDSYIYAAKRAALAYIQDVIIANGALFIGKRPKHKRFAALVERIAEPVARVSGGALEARVRACGVGSGEIGISCSIGFDDIDGGYLLTVPDADAYFEDADRIVYRREIEPAGVADVDAVLAASRDAGLRAEALRLEYMRGIEAIEDELRVLPCGCGPRKLVVKYRIPKPSV